MWWRSVAVGVVLAAPVAVVVAVAWPEDEPGAGAVDEALAPGDRLDGFVGANGVSTYEVVGEGAVATIGVLGQNGFDPTLTLVDADSGASLGFEDDGDLGTDPELDVELAQGQRVRAEVRGFSGSPGAYVVYLEG